LNRQPQHPDDLARRPLHDGNFVKTYRHITSMRFPVDVASVLDIRASLNQAIDEVNPEQVSGGLKQFNEAVFDAISQLGIKHARHISRLTKLMSIFRELHHNHITRSRKHERGLRNQIRSNEDARTRSIGYGLFTFFLVIVGLLTWMIAGNALWFIKLGIGLLAYISFDYFMSLKTLKIEHEILGNELNQLLRQRIPTMDWKVLLEKTALVMGYKNEPGVDVFLLSDTGRLDGLNQTLH